MKFSGYTCCVAQEPAENYREHTGCTVSTIQQPRSQPSAFTGTEILPVPCAGVQYLELVFAQIFSGPNGG